eukprot:SAG31_NODE_2954_length_4863_cov_34.043451_5_plen_37_part_00
MNMYGLSLKKQVTTVHLATAEDNLDRTANVHLHTLE